MLLLQLWKLILNYFSMPKRLLFYAVSTFILIVASISFTNFVQNRFGAVSLSEPGLKTYSSDEMAFLKTFYLMEKGQDYYSAYKTARENYSIGNLISSDVSTWRMPTVFFLWHIFANSGLGIFRLFVFFLSIFLVCVYLIFKKTYSGKLAILSILILLPYLYDTFSYNTSFLFTEWWSLFFFFFALTSLIYKLNWLAIFLFTLALITREIFIIPMCAFLIIQSIQKKEMRTFLFPILLFLPIYALHWFNVSMIMANNNTHKIQLISRIHKYDLLNLQNMVAFLMRRYVLLGLKTHYLVLFLGIVSITLNGLFFKRKDLIYFFTTVAAFLIVLPIISVKENDYWGLLFVPLILMFVPLIIPVIINIIKTP